MVYRKLFEAVLARTDAERAHRATVALLARVHRLPGAARVFRAVFGRPAASLAVRALGQRMPSPVGIAAGFDKDAAIVLPLLDMGFGHVEVGTVTAQSQPGNDRPRLVRLTADDAIVNRMGFNNHGAEAAAERLAALRATRAGRDAVIGVNIGKTKRIPLQDAVDDYRTSARLLAPHASYLAVNVSSPNTPQLRELQAVTELRPILAGVLAESAGVPVLVKIAPDLPDEDIIAVARLARDLGLAGVIATNTTIARPASLRTPRRTVEAAGAGGLSGPVLARRSLQVLDLLHTEVGGNLELVSVGGVTTAADVQERLDHGATLVQGYTALIYQGPFWGRSLNRGLVRLRDRRRAAG